MSTRESLIGQIRSEENPEDSLTNVITGQKEKHIVLLMLYDIKNDNDKQLVRMISWTDKLVLWLCDSVHGYTFQWTRKVWPQILFVSRESE